MAGWGGLGGGGGSSLRGNGERTVLLAIRAPDQQSGTAGSDAPPAPAPPIAPFSEACLTCSTPNPLFRFPLSRAGLPRFLFWSAFVIGQRSLLPLHSAM